MGSLNPFLKPKQPKYTPLPSFKPTAKDVREGDDKRKERMRLQQGRAGTIYSDKTYSSLATKELLGE